MINSYIVLVLDAPLDGLQVVVKLLSLEALEVLYPVLLHCVVVAGSNESPIHFRYRKHSA